MSDDEPTDLPTELRQRLDSRVPFDVPETLPFEPPPTAVLAAREGSPAPRYRIVRELRRGATARVFEAVVAGESGFERRVAMKQLLPEHAGDPHRIRAFLDEAQLAGRFHHANLVAALDAGTLDGLPFAILELVDGDSLAALIELAQARRLPMPSEVALHVAREVAHGLAHAHALGLVHRDVSPDNVLVSWAGDVKLTDFGIAFAARRRVHTAVGVTQGSPGYMAPEQLRADDVDPRTDVYALGCVLHALLTGRSPAGAAGRTHLDPGLPSDLAAIILRATAAARRDRFPSATDLAEQLTAVPAARARRDPRLLLCEWLASLESRPAATAGGLDALFSIDALLPFEPPAERPRTAVTRRPDPPPRRRR